MVSSLKVKNAEVKDNTIIYTLTDEGENRLKEVGEHEIIVIPEKDSERIESKEDKDGNSKKFKPLEKGEKLKFRVNVEEDIKSWIA